MSKPRNERKDSSKDKNFRTGNQRFYKDGKPFDRKGKSGNKPPKNKPRSQEGAVVSEETGESMNNDPNWYFTEPEVANQAGQLSFQSYLGTPSTFGTYTMPTIMTIHMNPSPGNTYPGARWALNDRSGFNMSMTKLYNRLSMKSGRNMAYAPQDVGMAVLGMGELLSMISYGRRLFGVAKWWNVRNRMVPRKVIKAMGIDPDDFFEHFSDYRMRFNTLILACNQIPILTNCGYIRKCISLYDDIYYDCSANMAQMYIYVPYSTWILDEASDNRGTVAKTTKVVGPASITSNHENNCAEVHTFAWFLTNILEVMVSKLLTSSTLNLVYADILNLNKTEDLRLMSIDIVDEAYAVMPQHDPLVLKQIHNSVAMGIPDNPTETTQITVKNDVVCDPNLNAIKYSPAFINPRTYGASDPQQILGDLRIIDTDNSDPDLKERIEITRYLSTHTNSRTDIGGVNHTIYDVVTDHYVTNYIVYTDEIDAQHGYFFTSDYNTTERPSYEAYAHISQFDWHPILYHYAVTSNVYHCDEVISDLNSFTIVDMRYLQRLNTIIYMQLFEFRS